MPDESLTNAAIDRARFANEFMSAFELPPDGLDSVLGGYTDDFVYDDRRSIIGIGRTDAAGWAKWAEAAWAAGSGRPRWSLPEVIALRGERIAAAVLVLDFGDDNAVESIIVYQLDADLRRWRRIVLVDIDDREAAIAEVERLHAEIDA